MQLGMQLTQTEGEREERKIPYIPESSKHCNWKGLLSGTAEAKHALFVFPSAHRLSSQSSLSWAFLTCGLLKGWARVEEVSVHQIFLFSFFLFFGGHHNPALNPIVQSSLFPQFCTHPHSTHKSTYTHYRILKTADSHQHSSCISSKSFYSFSTIFCGIKLWPKYTWPHVQSPSPVDSIGLCPMLIMHKGGDQEKDGVWLFHTLILAPFHTFFCKAWTATSGKQ